MATKRKLSLAEARAEAERYLSYLAREEIKTAALARIATERRAGRMDLAEAHRQMRILDGPGVAVYDGAKLADAIETFLAHT